MGSFQKRRQEKLPINGVLMNWLPCGQLVLKLTGDPQKTVKSPQNLLTEGQGCWGIYLPNPITCPWRWKDCVITGYTCRAEQAPMILENPSSRETKSGSCRHLGGKLAVLRSVCSCSSGEMRDRRAGHCWCLRWCVHSGSSGGWGFMRRQYGTEAEGKAGHKMSHYMTLWKGNLPLYPLLSTP